MVSDRWSTPSSGTSGTTIVLAWGVAGPHSSSFLAAGTSTGMVQQYAPWLQVNGSA
jgi:hypothetical protein